MLTEAFEQLLQDVLAAAQDRYGDRLITVAAFGSVARRTMRHDSDVDLLVIAYDLPRGRLQRMEEFSAVEEAVEPTLRRLHGLGIDTRLSPVFKTPVEVEAGSPIFLDMVEDARVLYDRRGFFAQQLEQLRRRLAGLGAKRVWRGNAWYWDLKPDYRPGEVFEL